MATIIHFVGRDQVMVREDEREVELAFAESAGRPVALTHHRSGNSIFVNLGQVTYWQGRGSRDVTQLPWPGVAHPDPALSAAAEDRPQPSASRQLGQR